MLAPSDLFSSLDTFQHGSLFEVEHVWDVLKNIKGYIKETIEPNVDQLMEMGDVLPETVVLYEGKVITKDLRITQGSVSKGQMTVKHHNEHLMDATVVYAGTSFFSDQVQIGIGSVIEPGALLKEGCIIGDRTEVRQGAYLRGSCLVGDKCVVGHTTEIKNSVFLDGSKAGHFAYVGDSILGNDVNLGAGTKLANLQIGGKHITLRWQKKDYDTGLRKFGAIIGDDSETGCNTVTVPGTVLGPRSMTFPNATVRAGFHGPGSLIR